MKVKEFKTVRGTTLQWSQYRLAKELGIHPSTIGRMESGNDESDVPTIYALSMERLVAENEEKVHDSGEKGQ
jgi:DNA-binding XRE family transcriptional regulator